MKIFKTISIDDSGLDFIQFVYLIYKNIFLLLFLVTISCISFYLFVSNYQNNNTKILKNSAVNIEVDCQVDNSLLNFIYNLKRISSELTYSDFENFFLSLENCELLGELESSLIDLERIRGINKNIIEISSLINADYYKKGILANKTISLKYKFLTRKLSNLSDSNIQSEINDVTEIAKYFVNKANERVYSRIIYYLNQVTRFVQTDIDKDNFVIKNFGDKGANEIVNLQLQISENIYVKNEIEKLRDLFTNTMKEKAVVFIFLEDLVTHNVIEVDKERLNLFHKIKASILTVYFLLFSTLIFILLIVFINSLLNSRIINEK